MTIIPIDGCHVKGNISFESDAGGLSIPFVDNSRDVANLMVKELAVALLPNLNLSELSTKDLGEYFYRLAKLHYDKCAFKEAESYFLKALSYFELPRASFTAFKTCGFLIRIHSESQNQEMASIYIEKSEEILRNLTVSLGTLGAEYFYNLSVVQTYRGKFAEARENFLLSYRKSQEENEPSIMAKSLYSLAIGCYNTKNYDQAINHLDQLAQLLQILKKDYLLGSMHVLYGNVYSEMGDFKNVFRHYELAMRILQQKNCWNLYAYVILGLGVAYKRRDEYNKALLYFEMARNSSNPLQFKRLNAIINAEISEVNDSNVELHLDRANRMVQVKEIGAIDFKHRFVLLEILCLLAQTPGKYFDKDDLSKSIWREEYNPLIHDKLIYTSISRLRKLIEPTDLAIARRKYILRGKDGYTFNPAIKVRLCREHSSSMVSNIGNVELTSPV